jgi:hypothetical protein
MENERQGRACENRQTKSEIMRKKEERKKEAIVKILKETEKRRGERKRSKRKY